MTAKSPSPATLTPSTPGKPLMLSPRCVLRGFWRRPDLAEPTLTARIPSLGVVPPNLMFVNDIRISAYRYMSSLDRRNGCRVYAAVTGEAGA